MYGTVRVLRNIIYAAAEKGGDLHKLCAALGIRPGELNDAEKRIEGLRPIVDLWREVIAATGDPMFGLHLGQVNNPSIFGALGYLMQSCRTLKEAYAEVVKYQQTVSGWISYDAVAGKELELIFRVNPVWQEASPETARQAVEMAMGGVWNYMYILTGKKIYPLRAEFAYRSPVSRISYEEVFKCPVAFDKPQNRVVFEGRVGDMPLISADESLYASFAQILREKTAVGGQSGRFGGQVRTIIARDFGGKIPSLEIIAAHMNMSERSFQRRLQQDGESYRSLAAEMKKELAVNLLQNTDATVHAISEVLGYTEPSAFHRAFKSWTHTSPARQKHSLGSSEK
ncbi:AraC family transcriptional regulator [Dyadobacter jiangsuensis]|uniref:AraC-like DNA-binding protein n=1 Tax=Dyadobacter jiangsuensis TaxID=1591085 RepID=A0A2P8GJV4_9BACT|nr:AraC family transcriptional regulator [Dyadobacter jiangsuensis]PSL34245.1 AraC-like DNA-binding protein [Dyadobacter jiangsuensis]